MAKEGRFHRATREALKLIQTTPMDPNEWVTVVPILEKYPVRDSNQLTGGPDDCELDPDAEADRILFSLTGFVRRKHSHFIVRMQRTETRARRKALNSLIDALNHASDILPSMQINRNLWLTRPGSDPITAEEANADFQTLARQSWSSALLYAAVARNSLKTEPRGAPFAERDWAIYMLSLRLERMALARKMPKREIDKIQRAVWRAARLPGWDSVPAPDKAMSEEYRQIMKRIRDRCLQDQSKQL